MVALLCRFRPGDRVRINAKDEFYQHVDGWQGRVFAIGPKAPTSVHSQIPEGYCAMETDDGKTFLVPHDELEFAL